MTERKDVETLSIKELEDLTDEFEYDAMVELAETHGWKGVEKDVARAVSLLEECLEFGDEIGGLFLAECYAIGHGVEQDVERAEAIISEGTNGPINVFFRMLKEFLDETRACEKLECLSLFLRQTLTKHCLTFGFSKFGVPEEGIFNLSSLQRI